MARVVLLVLEALAVMLALVVVTATMATTTMIVKLLYIFTKKNPVYKVDIWQKLYINSESWQSAETNDDSLSEVRSINALIK